VSGNPNWTRNRWAGYSVKRTTNLGNKRDLGFSEIKSNTSKTLTYASGGGFKPDLSFAAGDSLQLWKVDQALDQPGVSGGSLLWRNPATITPGWNDQVVTPCYSWNNTQEGGVHVNFGRTTKVVRRGVHYFNDTAMPGYTPYIYPHPLTVRAMVSDFNGDGSPDFVLQNASTGQTAVWYMDNNTRINSAFGPTTWAGWNVAGVADFNNDGHPDYLLFSSSTGQTAIWYLNNNVRISSAFGPTTWAGWNLVAP
jgi:hypothetical protein